VLEWYDFSLYGTAVALVFSQLFFPSYNPFTAILASFGTFAVGFFARPVGAIVFDHYGDKIGRRAVLIIPLMLMGTATALIGLLPGYETIGVWAPILLIILRIFQGFGSGAEFAGAVVMTAEYSPRGRRGFYASWLCTGVLGGVLLATGIFNLVALLPEEQFLAWGWRVPFLLSLVVVAVGWTTGAARALLRIRSACRAAWGPSSATGPTPPQPKHRARYFLPVTVTHTG
jgi:MFS transporter, MHS family, shikimate and dehydroshikimate transport protein